MTTRRDFIAASAAIASVPAMASAATVTPSLATVTPSPTATPAAWFDLPAFNAALATPRTHKHLFTSVLIEHGHVLDAMRSVLDAYSSIGTNESEVQVAAVLYHGPAIAMGFDGTMWDKYFVPAAKKDRAHKAYADFLPSFEKPPEKGNPFFARSGGDFDLSIESLVKDNGARFFMCNEATKGFAHLMAKTLGLKGDAVYADLAAHVVPNAMLVPNGVWAVHAVQERGYTLLPVNLQTAR